VSACLKILYVIDSLEAGGAEHDLAESLPRLAAAGVRPIVVALRRHHGSLEGDVLRQGFDVRFLDRLGMIGRGLALRRIIRRETPDLIHTVLFHSDLAGRLAAMGTGVQVLSSLVSTDYSEERFSVLNTSAARLRIAQSIDGWMARHLTHHLHANSNAVKAAAIRDLGILPERITVIEGGRNPVRLGQPSPERRRQARSNLGFRDEDEILLNVGRQDNAKGQCYLLEATEELARRRPHLFLLVAGRTGDASQNLVRLCQRPGIRGRVHILGDRHDVPDLLAAADLFVFPSVYEGLPNAIIEAMALGLPIVATDIPPHRELLEERRNALLVRPKSSVELTAAIERLLEDRQTALAFGHRSQQIFASRFTLDGCVRRKLELYRALVAQRFASNTR
jgi:glycosyltransferase involved in cell wall biosynthesis